MASLQLLTKASDSRDIRSGRSRRRGAQRRRTLSPHLPTVTEKAMTPGTNRDQLVNHTDHEAYGKRLTESAGAIEVGGLATPQTD